MVLSALLALFTVGGWAAALVGWAHLFWLVVGAIASLLVVLAAADLVGRLSEAVLAARDAAQRAAEGQPQVRMPSRPAGKLRDEADELADWFNRLLSEAPGARARVVKTSSGDPLTGLLGHRQFHDRLAEEIRRSERYDHELSLLMVDLDGFQGINESQGHAAGDEVLRQAGHAIASAVRATDVVARYGGDEFALFLPETDLNGALQVASKIRAEVAARDVFLPPQSKSGRRGLVRLTVSIGVASYPQHSTRKDGLIMAADVAMYMAKHSGRNKVCPFNRVPGGREFTDPYQLYQFLQNSDWGALEALVAAVDARDRITGGHSRNVTTYAVTLARAIGLADYDVNAVRTASLLHDVGKIGIPDRVLVKAGPLTPEERALMESHPGVGESLARRSLSLSSALPGILYHHECYDGRGYPTGLAGEDIPLIARIIGIADAYDAMVSHRHYRTPPGQLKARRELEAGAGKQWDPELVRAFLKLIAQGHLEPEQAIEPAVLAGR